MNATTKAGYVVTDDGRWLVQVPAGNEWGFSLLDDEQSWPGGIGAARSWRLVDPSDVPAEVRDALGWILAEAE